MVDFNWSSMPTGKRVTPPLAYRLEIHVELADIEGTGDREEFDHTNVTSIEWDQSWLQIDHDNMISVFPRDMIAKFRMRTVKREDETPTVKPDDLRLDDGYVNKLFGR